jgi:hypothetical protein
VWVIPVAVGGGIALLLLFAFSGKKKKPRGALVFEGQQFASEEAAADHLLAVAPVVATQRPLREVALALDGLQRLGLGDTPQATELRTAMQNRPAVKGIRWGGETFADAGAWRAHVRPIYGPTLAAGGNLDAVARQVAGQVAAESETARRLRDLNRAHKAFTSEFAKRAIARAAQLEAGAGMVRA